MFRTESHILVTEYGWTNLKGKTCGGKALAFIELAHPKARDQSTQLRTR